MKKWITRVLLWSLAALTLLWIGDYAVLRVRISHGAGTSTVRVSVTDEVTLKNGKTDFYFEPPQDTPCVESLFPHQGMSPCWNLRRHADRSDKYFSVPNKY